MKLKTLKDLKYFAMIVEPSKLLPTSDMEKREPVFVKYDELKEEAVKEARALIHFKIDKLQNYFERFGFNVPYEDLKLFDYIIEKNNLTEEDLK